MSPDGKKTSILTLRRMKAAGEKIAALTAYDYPSARVLDRAGVDIILVGDSAANVVLGYDSTLPVSMEEMLVLSAAVARGVEHALLVADMPFMSYQLGARQALENAGRFVKEARVEAVKLEGGERSCKAIEMICEAGIPVMAHIGLTPQSFLQFGGHRVQGRDSKAALHLLEEARRIEAAGAFAVVLEGMPWTLAGEISAELSIPTIGIGAGENCDGQILVLHDMIGLGGAKLKFVKRYAELERDMETAVRSYCDEVRAGSFPGEEHRFSASSARDGEAAPRSDGGGKAAAGSGKKDKR